MVKDIYIIKNQINSKVYIGQSVNAKQRWAAHLSNARLSRTWSAIDQAIKKLGAENFYYEIIETVHNYNEREIYWIKYYNSILPNGYNYCLGGSGAETGVGSANAKIRNNEELEAIIQDLMTSSKSQVMIANEHNIDRRIISSINRGTAYKIPGLSYPIRKKKKDLSESMANLIQLDLLSCNFSLEELAVKYTCSLNTIQELNRGKLYKNLKYTYPLFNGNGKSRKLTEEQENNLKWELQHTTVSFSELAKKYNISANYIRFINTGKSRYNNTLDYPLRKHN